MLFIETCSFIVRIFITIIIVVATFTAMAMLLSYSWVLFGVIYICSSIYIAWIEA